jgi:phage major head subunit gpT-like protein
MSLIAYGGATRANFGDLLEPGFRTIFFDQFQTLPTVYDKIFKVNSSSKQQEYDSSVSGFGQLVETTEGAPITYEDPIQGYDKSYVHKKYTKGFKITREMYEDDQYGVMAKMPKALASATNRTVETICGNIFDNAFTSGTGGDGKYLCATDHPLTNGGTALDNSHTYGFNETYLETALLSMRATTDDKGQKILVRPDTLLVPPALEKEANIMMKSTGRTSTNYNEINPYQGRLNIMVWDYLDNTQAWFILDSGLHQLNFFWRVKPEFAQDESFDTDAALYKTRCRFSVGFSDWRGVWGSTGTQ